VDLEFADDILLFFCCQAHDVRPSPFAEMLPVLLNILNYHILKRM